MADGTAGASRKFCDPAATADGKPRAAAPFVRLETLWVNTGTLCNIACARCYIESSPANDRLAYFSAAELAPFLDEARARAADEIAFTGGEPFLNPELADMARMSLDRGFSVLILTNAMRPMMRPRPRADLLALRALYGAKVRLRVSLDHYTEERHDAERGPGAFRETLAGLAFLAREGFAISVAGRTFCEDARPARVGFAALFAANGLGVDASDPNALVLFPEMDAQADTPEISEGCWDSLGKSPASVMCATSRMVVKRKGAAAPTVLACTLIPYDARFDLGPTLAAAARPVALNHPHCSRFCVLGGASCSPRAAP